MKFHTALPVKDIQKTKAFYTQLFNTPPVKEKSDYLKFLPDHLQLNISFIQSNSTHKKLHLGLEAQNEVELNAIYKRLNDNGLLLTSEKTRKEGDCCYAKQDKFWVKDPSNYEWEIYTVLEDTTGFSGNKNSDCC